MAGLSTLDKKASFGGQIATAAAAAIALEGIGAATAYLSDIKNKRKFDGVIDYAKKKHPELREVPKGKLIQQMNVAADKHSDKYNWFNQIFNMSGLIALILVITASWMLFQEKASIHIHEVIS